MKHIHCVCAAAHRNVLGKGRKDELALQSTDQRSIVLQLGFRKPLANRRWLPVTLLAVVVDTNT